MYFFLTCFLLPMVNAFVMVKIHQSAIYHAVSSCAFLRNITLSSDASIQSCIWECVHENRCQTAIYFNDQKTCSTFTESCRADRIQSSGNVQASTICYRTSQEAPSACSSTEASNQAEEKETTVSEIVTNTAPSLENTFAAEFEIIEEMITPAMTSQNQQVISLSPGFITPNQWMQYTDSYLVPTSGSLTLQFNFQASTQYYWYLADVSVQDTMLTEMLINGNFQSTSSPIGWVEECPSPCRSACGITTHGLYLYYGYYYDSCSTNAVSIRQAFFATSGRLYNIRFWIYLERVSHRGSSTINVTMNMTIS